MDSCAYIIIDLWYPPVEDRLVDLTRLSSIPFHDVFKGHALYSAYSPFDT